MNDKRFILFSFPALWLALCAGLVFGVFPCSKQYFSWWPLKTHVQFPWTTCMTAPRLLFGELRPVIPKWQTNKFTKIERKYAQTWRDYESDMSVSSRKWVNGVTLSDSVKEKIKDAHMHPGKQGKSLFLSTDESVVWNLVKDTFLHSRRCKPHRCKPHRCKPHCSKVVLQKRFPSQVGNLGCNGAMCFWVTVIYDKASQRIITAYPTWILTNIFYIWTPQIILITILWCFIFWNYCRCKAVNLIFFVNK